MSTKKKKKGGKTPVPGVRRWRLCLDKSDFQALDFFKRTHFYDTYTGGIRYALAKQTERDAAGDMTDKVRAMLKGLAEGASDMLKKFHEDEVKLLQWSCWLSPDDFDKIDEIGKSWGLAHKAESVRFAVRAQAKLEGFVPDGGVW